MMNNRSMLQLTMMAGLVSSMNGSGFPAGRYNNDWMAMEPIDVPKGYRNQPKKLSRKAKAKMKVKAAEKAKEPPKIMISYDFAKPGGDSSTALVYCNGELIGHMKSIDLPTIELPTPEFRKLEDWGKGE